MSEAAERLAEALGAIRAAALRALARRLGLRIDPAATERLERRYGLARSTRWIRRLARLPRPLAHLWLRWPLRGRPP